MVSYGTASNVQQTEFVLHRKDVENSVPYDRATIHLVLGTNYDVLTENDALEVYDFGKIFSVFIPLMASENLKIFP